MGRRNGGRGRAARSPAGSTDPVLRGTDLARVHLGSSGSAQQPVVGLGQEPHRDGEPGLAAELLPGVAQRRDMAANLLHVGVS